MFEEKEHPLWENFVEWSKVNCCPGGGYGHVVEFYWDIWKAAYQATLEDFHNHSVCCPARHEADKRLANG